MLVLVNPKTLTASLAVAPATTQPTIVIAYADITTNSVNENTNEVTLNGTTPVTILATPASGTRSVIKSVFFTNLDTVATTVTLFLNSIVAYRVTVNPGVTLDLATSSNNPGVSGSGTANRIPLWVSATALGNSHLADTLAGAFTLSYTGTLTANRAYALQDANGTVPLLEIAQTVSGAWTFSSSVTLADAKDFVVGSTTGTKIATATTQKLGFYGTTPVVQQNTTGTATGFSAGVGTVAKDDSTFTGGTGATAYRVSDIVRALKTLGLLAP